MWTTFASFSLNLQSVRHQKSVHIQNVPFWLDDFQWNGIREGIVEHTFQGCLIIQESTKVNQPYAARATRLNLPLLPPLP